MALPIWEGGLAFHGGFAGAIAGAWWYGRKHGVPFANEKAYQVARQARRNVPQRTGTLRRGIYARGSRSTGRRSATTTVNSKARHTLWVHEGTNGATAKGYYIDAQGRKRLRRLKLKPGGPASAGGRTTSAYKGQSFPTIRVRSVRGQRANRFLANALDSVWMHEFKGGRRLGAPRGPRGLIIRVPRG